MGRAVTLLLKRLFSKVSFVDRSFVELRLHNLYWQGMQVPGKYLRLCVGLCECTRAVYAGLKQGGGHNCALKNHLGITPTCASV